MSTPSIVTASGSPSATLVNLTPEAQAAVRRLASRDENEGKGLRLGIKGGGCSGLSYLKEFDTSKEGDTVLSFEGFEVYLDRKSTIYLSGITLHYEDGVDGRGFVFDNPHASNTCGCGESFSM